MIDAQGEHDLEATCSDKRHEKINEQAALCLSGSVSSSSN